MGEVIEFHNKRPEAEASLADRLAELLAEILDEPLALLPGGDPLAGIGPTELRFSHFRPDLSARAAELLEEAGW